ncbi:hypothetical protein [Acetobacter okinawensis]|uniref:hypothetical protein n=1 Tax=Acetobacter okinawensis TaxID=1076594 RepID=UPI0031FEA396
MPVRRRMNVYFETGLLNEVSLLAARRKVSKSAVVEMAVQSFLTGDDAGQREAALIRRLDHLSRQMEGMDEDLSILGETLALYVPGMDERTASHAARSAGGCERPWTGAL